MQAIRTKFLGPSNVRGSRIKASCERGAITCTYQHGLNGDENHLYACAQLVEKFVKEDQKAHGEPPENNPWNAPRVMGNFGGCEYHVYT